MTSKILMPALSPTMTEGIINKWLVKVGDTVKAGDIIAEIETDKATMEVEAVDEELSVKSASSNELNSDNDLNQSDVSQISNTPERTGAEELDENENRIQNIMENSHEEEMKNDRKTLQDENQITNEVNEGQGTNSIFEGVEDDTNIIDSDEDEDLLEIPAFLRRQAN